MSVQLLPHSPALGAVAPVEKPQYFLPKTPGRVPDEAPPTEEPDVPNREDFRARWWPGEDISKE